MKPGAPTFRREALFGGVGAVTVVDLLAGQAAPPFTAVLACTLDPGGRVGRHRQEQFPEIVVGQHGEGQATVNGAPAPLGPGDVVHVPLGAILTIENRSATAPLGYLIIKAAG